MTAMEVEVKLFGAMRDLAGRAEIRCAFSSDATVADLLDKLTTHYPELMKRLLPGIQQGYISVLADGLTISTAAGFETGLNDGSVVCFLPPIAGG
ncbi:ubiquitin-like small modifier protein 1 [Candidatus Bipolaricaulota bacterium]